ncbi:transcriptional regulator, AbrB family [Methanohalophilus mahii DSM 5219]|uniref:Transcriptional regulator, AbrB family n=2 Tax=Methanohalophilus mahii TaxID=2176 RepID=D5E8X4_METMS|nr:transcriptional regulator, AbrB family [Methanohalophilus mahii DSM 5219]
MGYVMTLIDVKSVTVSKKGQITIPGAYRNSGMKIGEKAAVFVYDDHIEIRPLSFLEEGLSCAIASQKSLSKGWDTPEEDAAWDHLKDYLGK